MKHHLITGGAGFIQCSLVAALLARGDSVSAIDNLSRGQQSFLDEFAASPRFSFEICDCVEQDRFLQLASARGRDLPFTDVWHMAANSDIPAGVADATVDLKDTFLSTFHTIEVAKALRVGRLHFASSSAIYGDLGDVAATEASGPLLPISNYGAMKLASEAAISAAVESHLDRASIFRFPNVIGTPATHGVIIDFIRKLKATPDELQVLGNGSQRKPYLHVEELVQAMLYIADHSSDRVSLFNIGPDDEGVSVRFIAEVVRDRVSPTAKISYGKADRGWVGDVPRFRYSNQKLRNLGWASSLSSAQAIVKAVDQIASAEGVPCKL